MILSRPIEHFIQLVKSGNYIKAGDAACVTPSAIRHSVLNLERRLGLKLINKGHNNIALTSVGVDFFEAANNIHLESTKLLERFNYMSANKKHLTIMIDGFHYNELTNKMQDIISKMRNKDIRIFYSPASLYKLKQNQCDLAICSYLTHAPTVPSELYSYPLPEEEIGLLINKELLNPSLDVISIIKKMVFFQKSKLLNHHIADDLKNMLREEGINTSFVGVPEIVDVVNLVTSGKGITFISESLYEDAVINSDRLIFIRKPFGVKIKLNRGIYFRKEDYNDLIKLVNCIKT